MCRVYTNLMFSSRLFTQNLTPSKWPISVFGANADTSQTKPTHLTVPSKCTFSLAPIIKFTSQQTFQALTVLKCQYSTTLIVNQQVSNLKSDSSNWPQTCDTLPNPDHHPSLPHLEATYEWPYVHPTYLSARKPAFRPISSQQEQDICNPKTTTWYNSCEVKVGYRWVATT